MAIHPGSSELGILAFSRKNSLNLELTLPGFKIRVDPGDRDEIVTMDHLKKILMKGGERQGAGQLFLFRLMTGPYSGSHGGVDLNLLHLGQSVP
jgi:hypothetical protein